MESDHSAWQEAVKKHGPYKAAGLRRNGMEKRKIHNGKMQGAPWEKQGAPPWRLPWRGSLKKAATYSPALRCSTIGAPGLNFSVRDGKRWNTGAKAT